MLTRAKDHQHGASASFGRITSSENTFLVTSMNITNNHRSQFDFMCNQARSYLLNHLLVLHTHWKDRLLTKLTSGRQINATQQSMIVDHYALLVLNKIQDLYLSTELLTRPRTDGFLMAYGVDSRLQSIQSPSRQLNDIYGQMEQERMNYMKSSFNAVLEQRVRDRGAELADLPTPAFLEPISMVMDREVAHKHTQPEIENPPKMGMEPWVRSLGSETTDKFGFLVYRLSYSESDEEWTSTKDKITKWIENGWEGVVGSETVKSKAVLRWMDGRKVKIEEGDLEGARA
jgi:hypothetical protein